MKNVYHAADDMIFPFLVRCIVSGYIDKFPGEAASWKSSLEILEKVYAADYFQVKHNLHNALCYKISSGRNAIAKYMDSNQFETEKALITITEASNLLACQSGIVVDDKVQEIYDAIAKNAMKRAGLIDENLRDRPEESYNQEKIKIIESAKRQAPKLIKILKQKNFFQNTTINT